MSWGLWEIKGKMILKKIKKTATNSVKQSIHFAKNRRVSVENKAI
jgi:hypothetical protein